MTERPKPPEAFAGLVDLAADELGGFALWATDEFFAEKDNLLKLAAPVFIEGKYTDRGKWMDGWESRRHREPDHDHCIIRLGLAGSVHGLVIDTTHFKGNAPQHCAVEALEAVPGASVEHLLASEAWRPLLAKTPVQPDSVNVFPVTPSARVSHVRLRIYPDGGVSRLRVYGRVLPPSGVFWRPGSLDLAAVEHGGSVAAVSDEFFGPPSNLLLPGRGTNMGDGWETKRRRTPGADWCVLQLGHRGQIERVQLDTHFFKGNAPRAVLIEGLDANGLEAAEVMRRLRAPEGWTLLLDKTPLAPHLRHELDVRGVPVTHVRVHIFPHGGVNRLRLIGQPIEGPRERTLLEALNAMPDEEAGALFASFCGSRAFVERLLAARPFARVRHLVAASREALWEQGEADWLEAFAAHPRLGESKKAASQTERSASWSRGEQAGAKGADADTLARLAELNERYLERHGFIFICFATGKSAREMLALLEERLERERAAEIQTAAFEQSKITQLRLEKWLAGA